MTIITRETLLERNKKYLETHFPAPTMAEQVASGIDLAATLVITCVDFRINPDSFLQTDPNDQILVSRNAGGRVTPALQQIMLFDTFVNLGAVVIIHHTDCGATHFKDESIREAHKARLPDHPEIDEMVFGSFGKSSVEESVRDDLQILKNSPYVSKKIADNSIGFVFDIKTGLLTPVV